MYLEASVAPKLSKPGWFTQQVSETVNHRVFFHTLHNCLTKIALCIAAPQLKVVAFSLFLLFGAEHRQSCHEILKIEFTFQVSQLRQIQFELSKNRNFRSEYGRIKLFRFREVSKKWAEKYIFIFHWQSKSRNFFSLKATSASFQGLNKMRLSFLLRKSYLLSLSHASETHMDTNVSQQ